MYSSYWTPNDGRESTVLTDHEALHRDAATHKNMQSDETQLRPLDLETIMSSKAAVKFWYLHRPKTMQYVHKNATKIQSLGRAFAVRKLRQKHGAEYMAELARQDQIKRDNDALKDLSEEERAAKELDDAAYDARVEESRRLRREQIEAERLAEEELRMKQAEAASERRRVAAEQEAAALAAKQEAERLAEEERLRAEEAAEAERVRKLEEEEAERVRKLEEEEAERIRQEEERIRLEEEEKAEAERKAEEQRLAALEAARLAEEARIAEEEEAIRAEEERLRKEEEERLAEEERVRQEEAAAIRADEERLRLEEEERLAEEERIRQEEEAALFMAALAKEEEEKKEKERQRLEMEAEEQRLREEEERLAQEKAEAHERKLAEAERARQALLEQEKMERYEQSLSKDVPVLVRQRGPGRIVSYDKEDETYDVRLDNAMGGVHITVPSHDVNLDDDRILSPRTKVDTPFGTGEVVGLDPHVGCYAINTEVNAPDDDQFLAFVQIQDVAVHEEEVEERAIVEDASLPIPDEIGLVSARIVDSRIVNRTGKKFIQYKLEIRTSNYGTVYCWKRYSTFRSLCDRLVKEAGMKRRDIPELPHRHIVGNFSQKTIGERAEKLNLFLNAAVKAEHLQWGIRVDDQIAVYKRRNKRATQPSSNPSSSSGNSRSSTRSSRSIFSRRR